MRLHRSGCRSSPRKVTLGSAARLQAPSLTPRCRYQLFAVEGHCSLGIYFVTPTQRQAAAPKSRISLCGVRDFSCPRLCVKWDSGALGSTEGDVPAPSTIFREPSGKIPQSEARCFVPPDFEKGHQRTVLVTLFSYFSQSDRHVLLPGQGYPEAAGEDTQVGDGHLPGVDNLHPPGALLLEVAEAGPAKAVVVDFVLPLVGGESGTATT